MTSRPMKTMTTDRIGAFSTGRMMTRSISTPPTKAIATVSRNAAQYGTPAWISAPGDVGGEHRHLALREVHQVRRLVDHHQRQRHAGVDAAGGEAGEDLVQQAGSWRCAQ